MLIFLYLVFLCSNFLFIKCDDGGNVRINVTHGHNCTLGANYTFTEGQQVTLNVTPSKFINFGWWQVIDEDGTRNISDNLKTIGQETSEQNDKPPEPTIHKKRIDKNMSGKWEFKFLLLRNSQAFNNYPQVEKIRYPDDNGATFIVSMCRTNVKIVPPPATAATTKGIPASQTLIIASVVGAILVAIIVAQTAYIMFLKAKAQKLINMNAHNNLSKRSDSVPDDTARYCSNPGQKMMKDPSPVYEDNRDSVIYEAPNIEIPSNQRMPIQPPQPPAITTMPRTPRAAHNMRIGPQAMLASALNSPARSPMPENLPPNFQRFTQNDRDLNVANRPRLPLPNTLHDTPLTIPKHNPNEHMFQEVYEQMEPSEENTYEPPPVINAMPPRLPMPPKKVPTGNLLDVKENTLKLRQGNKPPVTPKPGRPRSNIMIPPNEFEHAHRKRNDTMPKPTMTPMQQELAMRRRPNEAQTNELEDVLRRRNTDATNELEDVLRRRNNVKNVPIVSIPDPSSREPPKSRPPPSKPKGQPIPHPVQEEIYYNENQASSDEEWTYEPLKPLNIMQTPLASIPEPSSSKPRPPPSKPMGQQIPHPVQEGPPQSKPRGPPITHPIQEEIYYNPNEASSDEEWIYEPLKPSHSYDKNP